MNQKNEIVYRKISELIEPDYNPRKITAKQKEDIKASLKKYGFVQPLVININPERNNIIVGGNQRKKIAELLGYEDAPCILVDLSLEDEKELNIRLNKNQAEFDFKLLNDFFDKEFLLSVGFIEKEIGAIENDFQQKFNAITNDNCATPIIPKFNEKYGSVTIFFDSEINENWLINVLELEKAESYKKKHLGIPYVITCEDFQKIWEKNMDQ